MAQRKVTFTLDDIRDPNRLEKVLRQFQSALSSSTPVTPKPPNINELASRIAPLIRSQLQAPGGTPLNLKSLLPVSGDGVVIQDTHANRLAIYPAPNYAIGTVFYETDRTQFYAVSASYSWYLIRGGIYTATLANIPTGLGTADNHFLFEVSDYDHILEWTGAAWTWGPGEVGSGYYQLFEAAPNSIGASAWQICDGTAVDRLNADGTVTNITTPNLGTAAYLKGGTSSAAVAPSSGVTTVESTHTHAVDPPDTASGAPSATVAVQAGVGTTVATDTHTHNTDIGSFASGAGSAHDHGPNTLELRNKQARLYFRR